MRRNGLSCVNLGTTVTAGVQGRRIVLSHGGTYGASRTTRAHFYSGILQTLGRWVYGNERSTGLSRDPPVMARIITGATGGPGTFTIRTLRPDKLTPADCISLNGERASFNLRCSRIASIGSSVMSSPQSPSPTSFSAMGALKVRITPGLGGTEKETFPSSLKGFLYYSSPPAGVTPLAGEIRFRLTTSNDPSTFATGQDYCIRTGLPWRLPLLTLAWAEGYGLLRDMILREGLVGKETMALARALREEYKPSRNESRVIFSFRQPFVINLSTHVFISYFLNGTKLRCVRLWNICSPRGKPMQYPVQPFTGKIVCCFEPSQYPNHAETRTVVMRVLKTLTPVQYNEKFRDNGARNVPLPIEGRLLPAYYGRRRPAQSSSEWRPGVAMPPGRIRTRGGRAGLVPMWGPWSLNVDRLCPAMRALYGHEGAPRPASSKLFDSKDIAEALSTVAFYSSPRTSGRPSSGSPSTARK